MTELSEGVDRAQAGTFHEMTRVRTAVPTESHYLFSLGSIRPSQIRLNKAV